MGSNTSKSYRQYKASSPQNRSGKIPLYSRDVHYALPVITGNVVGTYVTFEICRNLAVIFTVPPGTPLGVPGAPSEIQKLQHNTAHTSHSTQP